MISLSYPHPFYYRCYHCLPSNTNNWNSNNRWLVVINDYIFHHAYDYLFLLVLIVIITSVFFATIATMTASISFTMISILYSCHFCHFLILVRLFSRRCIIELVSKHLLNLVHFIVLTISYSWLTSSSTIRRSTIWKSLITFHSLSSMCWPFG